MPKPHIFKNNGYWEVANEKLFREYYGVTTNFINSMNWCLEKNNEIIKFKVSSKHRCCRKACNMNSGVKAPRK